MPLNARRGDDRYTAEMEEQHRAIIAWKFYFESQFRLAPRPGGLQTLSSSPVLSSKGKKRWHLTGLFRLCKTVATLKAPRDLDTPLRKRAATRSPSSGWQEEEAGPMSRRFVQIRRSQAPAAVEAGRLAQRVVVARMASARPPRPDTSPPPYAPSRPSRVARCHSRRERRHAPAAASRLRADSPSSPRRTACCPRF
jgi:hypothetical protein